jgi:selenide, water dikinase
MDIKLTNYSISGGCGCKVPNHILGGIIKDLKLSDSKLIVSDFRHNEDSAIVKINDTQCLVYSLDFFTPIVDDPVMFGRIAAANAISDVYAKGAKPYMALSIFGFPKELGNTDIPHKITQGANKLCEELDIMLLGGHTIYNPQILFGLSVVGIAEFSQIKLNTAARAGDLIYLTKPIGSGILSTAIRRDVLTPDDHKSLLAALTSPNKLGAVLGDLGFVHCMTDVTGFGLLGHLVEICTASGVSAKLHFENVKTFPNLVQYMNMGIRTAGGQTNWGNYHTHVNGVSKEVGDILSDPQSNGGLLITVDPDYRSEFEQILVNNGFSDFAEPIGEITEKKQLTLDIVV